MIIIRPIVSLLGPIGDLS